MDQLTLFATDHNRPIPIDKPAAPFAPGLATSQAAAAAIGGDARFIRQRVLAFIRSRREYGATDPEIAEALDLSGDTARPRRVRAPRRRLDRGFRQNQAHALRARCDGLDCMPKNRFLS